MVTVTERVRFTETDAMAVVHHANYFHWFEMGRVEYMRRAGVLLNAMMADDVLFPITNVGCKYIAPAKFDDVINIETMMQQFTKAKMIFTYKITRAQDGTLLAVGKTQNVFTNTDGHIMRLPSKYYEKLQAYCNDDLAQNKI